MSSRTFVAGALFALAIACTRGPAKETPGPASDTPGTTTPGTTTGNGTDKTPETTGSKPPAPPPAAGDNATAVAGLDGVGGPTANVATVDGFVITEADLQKEIKTQLLQAQSEYLEKAYQLRAGALEQMIDKHLVDKKAEAEKLTADALLERDVYAKVQKPTDAEVQLLYQQAVQQGQQLPPLDEIKDKISDYILEQKKNEALSAYQDQLKAASKVDNLLPPMLLPKIAVEVADGQTNGPATAPITIIEFSDFQCPFCKKAEPTVKEVLAAYPDKVRLVYREYPLPMHDQAQKASEAALCASDQGKYWEMHAKLFDNAHALDVPSLKTYAKDLGLDGAKFDACLDGGAKAPAVATSRKAGDEAGVNGTPAFFINGRPLSGALPFDEFKKVIEWELAHK